MSGISGGQAELLYTLPAAVTKNTYTTQAVFSAPAATAPVPVVRGGFFGPDHGNPLGRSLRLEAAGTIATTSAATFAPVFCVDTAAGTPANQQAIYAATAPTAAVTCQWSMWAWITVQAIGETGGMTWQVNGRWDQSILASGGVLSTAPQSQQFAGNITGLVAATTYFIELAGTWSASAAGNTTTLQQMFLWGLN